MCVYTRRWQINVRMRLINNNTMRPFHYRDHQDLTLVRYAYISDLRGVLGLGLGFSETRERLLWNLQVCN